MLAKTRRRPVWMKARGGLSTRARTIRNLEANLFAKLGREATDAEVAGMLAMSETKLRRLRLRN
jgi:DNA-directed RNA polymerase specialized sigma subunit